MELLVPDLLGSGEHLVDTKIYAGCLKRFCPGWMVPGTVQNYPSAILDVSIVQVSPRDRVDHFSHQRHKACHCNLLQNHKPVGR